MGIDERIKGFLDYWPMIEEQLNEIVKEKEAKVCQQEYIQEQKK